MRRLGAALLLLLAALGAAAWYLLPRPEAGTRYVVRRGDTLYAIARAHGVTVDDLRRWNGIEGDLIEVGQVIRIREGGSGDPPPPAAGRRRARRPTATRRAEAGGLPRPRPKPCLPPPSEAPEGGMVASRGLGQAEAARALRAVAPAALACLGPDGSDRVEITWSIRVGCDGLVDAVTPLDAGGADPALLACVADVIRHADFPAHDLPDGDTVTWPMWMER